MHAMKVYGEDGL